MLHRLPLRLANISVPSSISRSYKITPASTCSRISKMPLITSTGKPRVILGLMTFGPPGTDEKGARITSLDDFNKHLDYLQQQGYNEVDTARMYCGGAQEGWSKQAQWQSRGLMIATKVFPAEAGMHKAEALKEHFNKSLSELGTESVDIFYLHAPDRSVPFAETLEACNDLFKQGKFVQLGLSNYAAWEVAEIWNIANERGWVRPTIYQAMYNAVTRDIETELIPCCRKYGLDIVVYNPLAGGIFSGKYKTKDLPSEGRFANTASHIGNMYRDRYFKDATFDALKLVEPVVEKNNLTLLETALRWLVHHSKLNISDGNDGVIIGVSSISQLEGNLKDLEKGPLPDEVVEALNQAWQVTKATTQTYWR